MTSAAPYASAADLPDGVAVRRGGPVAGLWLNRPDRRNAIGLDDWAALRDALAALADGPPLRLLVLRGASGAFAAGADIAEFATRFADEAGVRTAMAIIQDAHRALEAFPAVTLALIEGPCVGAGCTLALACDRRIAAPGARLGVTPAKLGLSFGTGDVGRIVKAVGRDAARELLFTGRLVSAEEALALGLVQRIEPDLEAAAAAFDAQLKATSGASVRALKRVLAAVDAGATAETEESVQLFADGFLGPDAAEGMAAFAARRPPRYWPDAP